MANIGISPRSEPSSEDDLGILTVRLSIVRHPHRPASSQPHIPAIRQTEIDQGKIDFESTADGGPALVCRILLRRSSGLAELNLRNVLSILPFASSILCIRNFEDIFRQREMLFLRRRPMQLGGGRRSVDGTHPIGRWFPDCGFLDGVKGPKFI